MAELSKTEVLGRVRHGNAFEVTYRVTCGAGEADEWIVTPFSQVYSAHLVVVGDTLNQGAVVINAEGTGEAAGSTLGAVGVERIAAGDVFITVVGR